MNPSYFFCLSYSNVAPILGLASSAEAKGSPIHIVVTMHPHASFWAEIIRANQLPWKVVKLDLPQGNPRNPRNWIGVRSTLREWEQQLSAPFGSELYLFSTNFALAVFALIRRLSDNRQVWLLDCDHQGLPRARGLRAFAYALATRLLYRIPVSVKMNAARFVLEIDQQYFDLVDARNPVGAPKDGDLEVLLKFDILDRYLTIPPRVVWLGDDLYTYMAAPACIRPLIGRLRQVLEAHVPANRMVVKSHPNYNFTAEELREEYSGLLDFPSFIPVDFLLAQPEVELIVGGLSLSLAVAARTDRIHAVSYALVAEVEDVARRDQTLKYLRAEGQGKIRFPTTWDELTKEICAALE